MHSHCEDMGDNFEGVAVNPNDTTITAALDTSKKRQTSVVGDHFDKKLKQAQCSTVNAYVMYNGVWELDGRDWVYKGGENLTFDIDLNLSYSGLVDVLYEELDVDKVEYDLKLEVNYKYRKGYEYRHEVIGNDKRARYFLSTLAKKSDEFIPLFVTLLKKNVCADPSPTPSSLKDNCSEVGSFVPETNPEVLVADVLPELNTMMPSADIVAQMPFIDGFSDGPDSECYVEGNDGVRDDQGTEVPAAVALNLTPLSYQIPPRPLTRKRVSRKENCQTPATSSNRPGETSNAKGTTDSTCPNNGRETNDISGPTDARGINVTGLSDPFSFSTSCGKFKEKMYTREDIEDHSHYISTGGTPGGELHVGKFFRDKEHLKMVVGLYAMKKGFDYYVRKSGTDIWYVTCKDTNCGWRLRAKKNVLSNMFEVSTFHNLHTCSLDLRGKDNRQASPLIVAHLIKDKLATDASDHLASDIRKSMHKDYGIQMSYEKAWRCREKALHLARGTPEDSYSKLPSYLHMLQLRNPGTITDFVVEDGRFKYCFFSLGPCIRGFRFCRPVVCVDRSFLKTRYGGQMLCAMALDAGSHIFPIAFAIVDSENHNSWTYFMRKLKETIGDVENLAFVSDRHQSIVRALDTVFPDAHHGACYDHIIMNVNNKFKTEVFTNHIYTCAYTYSKSEFHREFENIRAMNVAVAQYLEEIGFEKWVRSYFPVVRYNVMTSNWAESFNNTTKDARGFPIIAAVAFLRSKVQNWFASRKEKVDKWTKPLAPEMEEDLALHLEKSRYLNVDSYGPYTLQVHPGGTVQTGGVVDLQEQTCTCGLFQRMKFPCPHACAASQERSISVYALCSPYYTTEYWRRTYEGAIMLVGDEDDWELPDDIKNMTVGVPVEKQPVGRPKKPKVGRIKNNQTACIGERIIKSRNCSKCGAKGHNRSTCTYRG